ncbi:MAG: hypothetical protein SOR61_09070 [Evtepia sp.]|uniref:hypothetical protein n=1 Tax=Evtepia sp. TaxID=2773933 RepID=UPI002A758E57|nr:hypothetical protein [Evtepia sp.]MDY3015302.1 hypothetical protein [Evtepia sp.]
MDREKKFCTKPWGKNPAEPTECGDGFGLRFSPGPFIMENEKRRKKVFTLLR